MATYNGKSLSQVCAELEQTCETNPELLHGKYPYYPPASYQKRLADVLGNGGYTVAFSDISTVTLPTGQVILSCICTLSFIDDNGEPSYQTQGIGSFELIYSSEKNAYQWLNNAGPRLQQRAFKAACKSLRMFGDSSEEPGENESQKTSAKSQKSSSSKSTEKAKATPTRETFITCEDMVSIKTDGQTGKPVYKVHAHRVQGSVMESSESAIIFYPNLYKDCTEQLNEHVFLCSDGKQHKIQVEVTESSYVADDRKQYVFRGFWRE